MAQQPTATLMPKHVAIIMDGNGRWAKARGLHRSAGHQQGVATVETITETASQLGLEYLTLYAFSTENWQRPKNEVSALMSLILSELRESLFMKNNVRLRVIGDVARLPEIVQESIENCVSHTAANTGLTLVIALSYSSRWEITQATKRIAEEVRDGQLQTADINDSIIEERLTTAGMPAPDLLIRTGGEIRLSNFLLWQCAYAELYFTPVLWPDFSAEDFRTALLSYADRERRYGKTSEQVSE